MKHQQKRLEESVITYYYGRQSMLNSNPNSNPACNFTLTCDLDFHSQASCSHDPCTYKNSSSNISRFTWQSGNRQTDGQTTDASDCFTFPANAVGNEFRLGRDGTVLKAVPRCTSKKLILATTTLMTIVIRGIHYRQLARWGELSQSSTCAQFNYRGTCCWSKWRRLAHLCRRN